MQTTRRSKSSKRCITLARGHPPFARHSSAPRGEKGGGVRWTQFRWHATGRSLATVEISTRSLFRGCYMKNKFVARLSHLSFGSGRCIQNFNIVIPSPRRYIAACTYRAILYFGSFPEDIVPLTASKDASISPNVFQEVATINLWNEKREGEREFKFPSSSILIRRTTIAFS